MIPESWKYVVTHLSKSKECTRRGNPNGNPGLQLIMIRQYRFMNCNKCTTLVGDVDNRRGSLCVEAQNMWEISVSSSLYLFRAFFRFIAKLSL